MTFLNLEKNSIARGDYEKCCIEDCNEQADYKCKMCRDKKFIDEFNENDNDDDKLAEN